MKARNVLILYRGFAGEYFAAVLIFFESDIMHEKQINNN
jgi:hypothetical protein